MIFILHYQKGVSKKVCSLRRINALIMCEDRARRGIQDLVVAVDHDKK